MATHKAKVIGPFEVAGVAPGGTVDLDDERVNVSALVASRNVEILSSEVEGVLVESDVAGTGEAVNADTGEVIKPGEPLPPIKATKRDKKGDD
jgi:hypothetical protein